MHVKTAWSSARSAPPWRRPFNEIGEMDDAERSDSERDTDDAVVRTLKAIMHRLDHSGLQMLVNAHISQAGTPHSEVVFESFDLRATRRRRFLTGHVGFEARRKMSGRKPPG